MEYVAKIVIIFNPQNFLRDNFQFMCKILERIKEIAKHEGITIGALEKKIGASKGVLSRAIAKGTDIQAKWIESLVDNYPYYETEWLLTGNGDMLKTTHNNANKTISQPHKQEKMKIPVMQPINQGGIPLIPFSAMAGALRGEQTALEYECEHYIVPAFKNANFLITVSGNSMSPTYLSADIVACQRIPMSSLFFQWNRPYVLDTAQGAILKRIKPGSQKDRLRIISDNPEYDPFELPLSEIYSVALVIGTIRLE